MPSHSDQKYFRDVGSKRQSFKRRKDDLSDRTEEGNY
jgi:hypothetical protein